jgi:hypothetical protein
MKSLLCVTTAVALYCLQCPSAMADVVKTDLRTAASSQTYILAFCALKGGPDRALAGLAYGRLNSDYQWIRVISYPGSRASQSSQYSDFDSCGRNALIHKADLFVAQVDESAFSKMREALDHVDSLPRSRQSSDTFLRIVSDLSSAAGLTVPDSSTSPVKFVVALSTSNAGHFQDGVEWVWQPPSVKLVPHDAPNTSPPSTPDASVPSSSPIDQDFIATGVGGVPRVNRLALERFYQAIADAEDNPNIYYDVEFQIGGGILGDVYVHPLEVRRDAQTEKGDSLCIFFSGSDINADPIELVDRLLQLSNTDADIVSESWGFDSTHPILGTPRNWQAAVTSVPACYLAATASAELVSRFAPTPGSVYGATLVRGFPRYPRDKALFNSKAPVQLERVGSGSKEWTATERQWRTYRNYVDQVRVYAERRSGSYPGLSTSEIAKRARYAHDAASEDDIFWNVRKEFGLRELGWQQFVFNKYKGLQDQDLERYVKAIPVFYKTVQDDNKKLEAGLFDLSPFLRKQMDDYQQLMTVSALSRAAEAQEYQPDMTVRGRICDDRKAYCKELENRVESEFNNSISLSIADQSQSQFDNVIDLGVFSTDSTQRPPLEDFVPPNGVCKLRDVGTSAHTGTLETKVSITNKQADELTLSLEYVGSWTRAYWEELKPSDGSKKKLGPGESANFILKFSPEVGYEDLNLVYISKDEKPLAEVTLKYSIVEDAPIRTFEVDSPGFQSGASDGWLDYNLAVSQPPPMYTVRKACVWVQGDRSNCKDKKWTTCDVTSLTDDLVQVNFALQGHTEDPSAKRFSSGYMWVGYQLVTDPVKLH